MGRWQAGHSCSPFSVVGQNLRFLLHVMDLSRNSTRTEEAYSARGCPERRVTGVQSGTTFPPEITFLTVKSCDHCKSLNLSFGFAKRLMDFNKALSAIDERTVKLARILDDSQLSRLSDQMRKSEGIWAKIHDLEALEHRSDDLSLSPAPCDLQVHRSTPKKGSSAIGFFDEGLTLNETGPAHEDLHLNARSKEIGYTTENDRALKGAGFWYSRRREHSARRGRTRERRVSGRTWSTLRLSVQDQPWKHTGRRRNGETHSPKERHSVVQGSDVHTFVCICSCGFPYAGFSPLVQV
ncbi:uncharacterized protein LOC108942331 isoform X3 [Scleropages formosus]|uniref:uncharacterized protein LOC108942331 isoform X3 n=1 Tax=Scleropages formosus TaxID=113540 RepID=UPI000878C22D|nr:uncharacterized protein LOC108942331 isoform X3 [Scleropages formosus]